MKTKDETIADLLEYALELRHQWEWKRYEPRAGNQAEYDSLNETIEQARQVLAQAANEPRPLPLGYEILTRLNRIGMSDDAELRLIGGELTAQEIRTVRAFVRYILGGNSK